MIINDVGIETTECAARQAIISNHLRVRSQPLRIVCDLIAVGTIRDPFIEVVLSVLLQFHHLGI